LSTRLLIMIEEIYKKILNDNSIKLLYDKIKIIEDKEKGWAYHNYDHVLNVTKIVEKTLLSIGCNQEFILKAKIACLMHDVGALEGKDNHAFRSYEYAKNYFKNNNIVFNGIEDVLEAIKIHSNGFDTNNLIALSLIFADKLDIKKSRISEEGRKIDGNRQYAHIEDIIINVDNGHLIINFITDGKINMKEVNEYYFTKKVFNAIESFSRKTNLNFIVLMDNNTWNID